MDYVRAGLKRQWWGRSDEGAKRPVTDLWQVIIGLRLGTSH